VNLRIETRNYTIQPVKPMVRGTMGVLLLPICYGVLRSLCALAVGFERVPEGSFFLCLGFAGYLAFQWVFFKPLRTYVFGHELTHAMAAWITGGEVHSIKIGKKGGSVTVTKPNLFVALAPYMIPFYSMILLTVFFAIDWVYPLHAYWNVFLGLFGATLAFHAALTIFALRQNQPDLKTGGKFLSGVLIVLGNSLILVFLLGVLFPRTVSWFGFLNNTKDYTMSVLRKGGEAGLFVWAKGQNYLNGHTVN
jgi:hypothetical protein